MRYDCNLLKVDLAVYGIQICDAGFREDSCSQDNTWTVQSAGKYGSLRSHES